MAKSIYQMGNGFESIVVGLISDKCGRKVALRITVILEVVASLGQALSGDIYQFMMSRLLLGFASYGRYLTCYLLCKLLLSLISKRIII